MKFVSSSILPVSDRDAERERQRDRETERQRDRETEHAREREVTGACVNFSLPASAGDYKQ